MADYWIKLYLEILDDSKMAVLPDRLWRRVIELFLLAGRYHQGGNLPETRQLAWVLRFSVDDLEMDIQQIASTGIIQKTVTGWFIPKFEKRQAASTTSERVNQFRKREQHKQYEDETNLKRNVTQINRLTESDTDTESGDENFSLLPLAKAFCEESKLPELSGGPDQFYKGLQSMKDQGVTPDDLRKAVQTLRQKQYTIVSPVSCIITAVNIMAQRKTVLVGTDASGAEINSRLLEGI